MQGGKVKKNKIFLEKDTEKEMAQMMVKIPFFKNDFLPLRPIVLKEISSYKKLLKHTSFRS